MEVLSSVDSLGIVVRGYNEDVLAELLRQLKPDKIFITELAETEYNALSDSSFYRSVGEMTGALVLPAGVNRTPFEKFREDYIETNLNSPELTIKKNMLDLINDTISNYLAQYWKGPDTINSEVTDSLFRAKHKLFSSVFYDLENGSWDSRHNAVLEEIKKNAPTEKSVIISAVESRYWFKDHLNLIRD